MKLRMLVIGLVVAVPTWAVASASGGETGPRFSACLSGGKLTSVAAGSEPSRPCKEKEELVSWAGEGAPGLPGAIGETGPTGVAGSDGPGRVPGERLLNLAAFGAGWSCGSRSCDVFASGPLEGATSVACGTMTRTLEGLPDHGKVRIQASVGFVDDWQGDTAYLSLGTQAAPEIVWTQTRDARNIRRSLNIAGNPLYPDLVGQPIDVIRNHSATSLTITFGTTADCNAEASAAVNSLSVSIAP